MVGPARSDVEKTGSWAWIFSNHLGWGSFQYDRRHVPYNALVGIGPAHLLLERRPNGRSAASHRRPPITRDELLQPGE